MDDIKSYPVYRPSKKEFVYVSCLDDVEFIIRSEVLMVKLDTIVKNEERIEKMSLWEKIVYVFSK